MSISADTQALIEAESSKRSHRRRRMGAYKTLKDGEWYRQPEIDRISCCDCGLAHDIEYIIVADCRGTPQIFTRARRNNRATAALRREMIRKGKL